MDTLTASLASASWWIQGCSPASCEPPLALPCTARLSSPPLPAYMWQAPAGWLGSCSAGRAPSWLVGRLVVVVCRLAEGSCTYGSEASRGWRCATETR